MKWVITLVGNVVAETSGTFEEAFTFFDKFMDEVSFEHEMYLCVDEGFAFTKDGRTYRLELENE